MTSLKKMWAKFLSLVFPPRSSALAIQDLSITDFRQMVSGVEALPNPPADIVLFPYRHPLARQIIWELKYYRNQNALKILAGLLEEELTDYLQDLFPFMTLAEIILVPVPLSAKREKNRGYNQISLVLEKMKQGLGDNSYPAGDFLFRPQDTLPQTKIRNRQERIKNVIGAFAVMTDTDLADKIIFLIDDVTTTGATLNEAKKVLLSAGAKKVVTVAFAH